LFIRKIIDWLYYLSTWWRCLPLPLILPKFFEPRWWWWWSNISIVSRSWNTVYL